MALPTITRGIGWRDDMTDATLWTLGSGVTLSSDGDIGTLAGTTSSNGASQTVPGSLPTNTYPNLIVRAKSADGTSRNLDVLVTYTSGSSTFTMTNLATTWQPFTFPLTASKTISSVKFQNQSASGSILIDFTYPFKETLTLPSVRSPIVLRKHRNIVEIPIIQREGGLQQDLGSLSAEITVSGHLITTQAYTADQWWYILNGLTLETGTIQADGNPTWQWFQSDQIGAKVMIVDWIPQQPMGRAQFWDYALVLKKFDVNSETLMNDIGPITY